MFQFKHNKLSKIILTTICIIITTSCSNISHDTPFISYNTPFINSDEMIHLDFSMTKEEVVSKLGLPLYVGKGEGSTKSIFWIYEVRTVQVLSGENNPNKTHTQIKHNNIFYRVRVEFVNGKVGNWHRHTDF